MSCPRSSILRLFGLYYITIFYIVKMIIELSTVECDVYMDHVSFYMYTYDHRLILLNVPSDIHDCSPIRSILQSILKMSQITVNRMYNHKALFLDQETYQFHVVIPVPQFMLPQSSPEDYTIVDGTVLSQNDPVQIALESTYPNNKIWGYWSDEESLPPQLHLA